MSEITTLAYQKIHKPKIEEIIPKKLKNRSATAALEFVAYLRENKLNPAWTLHNAWKIMNKGKPICYIRLGWGFWKNKPGAADGKWEVTPYLNNISDYDNSLCDEGLQDFILDNLCYCSSGNCNNCEGSASKIIFGKKIENICKGITVNRFPMPVVNPNDTELDGIKKLIALERKARAENKHK